jgi:hypothetical protein
MVPAWFAAKLTLPGAHSSAGERPLHTREVPGSIPGAPIRKALENRSFRVKPSTGTGLGEHDGERRGSESDIAPRAMRLADTQKMKRSGKACGRAAAG